MLLVLVLSVGTSFASDSNQTEIQASDDTDTAVSISETDAVSSNGNKNVISVNNNDSSISKSNDETILTVDAGTFTALKSKLQNIGDNSRIELDNDYAWVTGDDSSLLMYFNYKKNVVIDGKGHTINANGHNIHFVFSRSSNIELKNINFKNATIGNAGNNGLSDSFNSGNLGSFTGLIIFNGCNQSTVNSCNFTNVNGGSWGSCVSLSAYAGYCFNNTLKYCNFNQTRSGAGGPVYTGGHVESIKDGSLIQYFLIDHCNFYQASTSGRGGSMELNCRYATVSNCNFTKCSANAMGVISLFDTASNAKIEFCRFINNSASNGGAISAERAGVVNATVNKCYFEGNKAVSGNGGAILLNGENGKIIECTFINNTAKSNGGAVSFGAPYGSITDSNFINNSATNGGAVYANAKNSAVDNCKFENNNATDGSNFYATAGNPITITNCGFDLFYVSDDGDGDGLRIGAPTNFVDAVQAIENGGRIILIGTFTKLLNRNIGKPVTIEAYNNNVVVDLLGVNNRAFTIAGNDVTLKGITFKNSKITGDGGVLLWNGANGVVDSCTFENNTAANGGAIYWAGTKGTVTGSTFNKNTATGNGGAIYWAGNEGTIKASTFTQNKAVYGSAVFLKNGVSTFDLKDTSFTSNVATTSGTVAAEKLTTFSIGGNTFTTNTATSGDNEYYFYDNSPVITSSLVYVSPTGSASSMGLIESSPTTLDHAIDTVIEDGGKIVLLNGNYNFARTINNREITFVGRTGAIITGSRTSRVFTITNSSKIVFEDLTFSGLSFGSTSLDGAISVSSSSLEIKNTKFQTITGSNLASVVTYDATSTGNITGSTFTGNTATNLANINGNVNITGSSFTSNTARTSSVSYNSGSKGTVSGTTFSGNSGTYRNLYVNTNNVVVTGSKFDTTASLNAMNIVVYPNNAVLSGSFNTGSNYAFSGISAKNGNTIIATGSVSSNTYSATWTKPLPGTYTITLANTDNKGNTFNYATTPSVSVPVRLTTVYIGPSATGAGTGVDNNNRATWDNVAGILTDTGTVIFAGGIYSNFYGKTINKSWKLTSSGSVTLNANNQERMFTISGNNVQITGLTFQNGKATDSYGSAIHWTGTGGSITNSILTANTGRPITATNTVTISNTQMKDQVSLSKSDINWGSTETITATFAHSAPSKITILFNGVSQGEYSATSGKVTQNYAYNNLATRSVGSYAVTMTDSNGNTYTFTDNTFTVSRIATVHVSLAGTGSGADSSSPTTWDNVDKIITDDGTVSFDSGTYTNFRGKTIAKPWTLNGNNAKLDAGNSGTIFTITTTGVKINGFTFTNAAASAIKVNTGASLTVDASKFTSNAGEAIYSAGTLTVKNSQFSSNSGTYRNIHSTGTTTLTGNTYDVTATINAANINIGDTVTISGNYNDGVNHARAIDILANNVAVKTNVDATSGTYSATWTPTGAGDKDYTLTIKDKDTGNTYTQSASKKITVSRLTFTITANVASSVAYGQPVTVTATGLPTNLQNKVVFKIGSNTQQITASGGTATATFNNLAGNERYTVTVSYDTDNNYRGTSVDKTFYVYKHKTSFTVSAAEVNVDKKVTVTLQFADSDVAGTAKVNIAGFYTDQPVTVSGGKATLELPNGISQAGSHTIRVTYDGNEKYNGTTAEGNVIIDKYKPTIDITVSDAVVDGKATITITVNGNADEKNPTGQIEFEVDKINGGTMEVLSLTNISGTNSASVTKEVTVNDAGEYTIAVEYLGCRAYDKLEFNKKFTVSLHQPTLVLTVNKNTVKADEHATVTATVTGDTVAPTGQVNVTVNGKIYPINLNAVSQTQSSGSAAIDILDARYDSYAVTGTYYGDRVYDKKSVSSGVSFKVEQYAPGVHVTLEDTIKVDSPTTITVSVDKTATVYPTGNVTILIPGNKLVTLKLNSQGVATYQYTFHTDDVYPIEVSYLGDKVYDKSASASSVNARPQKLDITGIEIISISDRNPYVDDTITVTAKVTVGDGNLTGNVTIVAGSHSKNVVLNSDGTASADFKLTKQDNYAIAATYNGNYKYNSGAKSATTTISTRYIIPTVELQVADVYVDGTVLVNVTVSSASTTDPKTPTGKVTLHIADRDDVVLDLNNGKTSTHVTFNLEGTYEVTATYMGDYKFDDVSSQTKNIVVSKYDTSVAIEVVDVAVDGSVTVNMTVTSAGGIPEGSAHITVDNKVNYPIDSLTGGKGSKLITFNTAGEFAVTAYYDGNYKFKNSEITQTINVYKLKPVVTVDSINAMVNEEVTINVHVEGADGNINDGDATVTIDVTGIGVYTVAVDANGNASKKVTIPFSTTFPITATYNGNYKYEQATGSGSIYSNQWGTGINVQVADVKVDDTLKINITVSGDSTTPTGNVTLIVGNLGTFNLTLDSNGKASKEIKFTQATVGSGIPVSVNYLGDVVYSDDSVVADNIHVTKYTPTVYVELLNNIKVDDVVIFNVTVSHPEGNISGNITLTVAGNNMEPVVYPATALDANGKYTQSVKFTQESNYQIAIQYSGNYKYEGETKTYSIDVTKYDTSLFVQVDSIAMAGDTMIINITVNSTATGNNGNIAGTIVGAKIGNGRYDDDEIVLDENGKASITITNIQEGKYDVISVFDGNYKYNSAEFKTNFTVEKYNVKLELNVTNTTTIGEAIFKVHAITSNYAYIDGVNVTVTGIPGGDRIITLNSTGDAELHVTDIATGIYPIGAYFYETYYYNYADAKSRLFVNKTSLAGSDIGGVTFTINADNIKVGQNVEVLVEVKGLQGEGSFHVPTGNITVRYDGRYFTNVDLDNNGKATLNFENVTYGNHTVSVTYEGNDIYFPDIDSTKFSVDKWKTSLELTVEEKVFVGQTLHIHVKVNETGVTNNVTFFIFGQRHNITLTGGEGDYTLVAPAGTHLLPVVYDDDDKYWGSDANQYFTVIKNESMVEVTVDPVQVGQHAVVNVVVKATDANSKAHPQGIVTLTINNKAYTVNLQNSTIDGQSIGSATIDVLPADTYSISAVYGSGPNYNGSSYNQTQLTVNKNASRVLVEVEPIQVGQAAIVTVTVEAVNETSKATPQNYVVVSVAGRTVNVNLDYETGEGYAKGRHVFTGITYGSYPVTATYESGINYGSSSNNTVNLVVNRNASDVIVSVKPVKVGQNATVYVIVKAHDEDSVAIPQGTVNITVNGVVYPVKLQAADGQAEGNVTINVLPAEKYQVTANYLGGPNYLGNTGSALLSVDKNASQVTLEVSDVFVGQNATIKVTVQAVDEDSKAHPQGNVTLTINRDSYTVVLHNSTDDGKSVGEITVKAYPYGNYIVSGTYSAGPNYSVSYTEDNAHSFNVIKNASKMTVFVAPVKVGQKATVYVNVSAADSNSVAVPQGNVTVTVGGKSYTIILSKAADGEYATGNVEVDPLEARNHTVYASYNGGPNYNVTVNNDFKFAVYKNESSMTVVVPNVQVGQKAIVYVNVTHAEADSIAIPQGNVTVTVEGKAYTIYLAPATDGDYATGNVTIDVLPAKETYRVLATYNSGPNYYSITNDEATFAVLKNESVVIVKVNDDMDNVFVGQNATVSVIVKSLVNNANAAIPQGNVTISVNGKTYPIKLTEDVENNQAVGSTSIDVLTAGTWIVGAVYNSGPNYNGNSSQNEFIVHKNASAVSVVVENVQVGQRAIVYVNVTHLSDDSKAIPQGNVTFEVGGKEYVVFLHNAKDGDYATGNVTLDVLPHVAAGYDFIAYYKSGPNYSESNSEEVKFFVNKNETSMIITVGDVSVETNNTISVKVLSNSTMPTGNVTIDVNQKQYIITLDENGEGSTLIEQLPYNNGLAYEVVGEYLGDGNYKSVTSTNRFVVKRYDFTLNIDVSADGYKVGQPNRIFIYPSTQRLTEKLHVSINGTSYDLDYDEQLQGFILVTDKDNLLSGSHLIVANYYGDELYNDASADRFVTLSKWDSQLNVVATNAYVGEDVYVKVNVTVTGMDDRYASGQVHITVDGKDYNVTLEEGKGSFDVKGLSAKEGYMVLASYEGDNYFNPSNNNSATFNVYKRTTNVTVTVDPITYLENATVKVVVDGKSNGTVTVYVDDVYKGDITLDNGIGELEVPGIETGDHTVRAHFNGDYKYIENENRTVVSVAKAEPTIIIVISDKDVLVGDDTFVNVTVTGASGEITIKVNDTVFKSTLNDNHEYNIIVPGLTKGVYTVTVEYEGDRLYLAKNLTYDKQINVRYANFTELKQFIDEAIANNESVIDLPYDYEFDENDGSIELPANVTINGNGHTIDANGSSTVFNVTGSGVTLGNLTVTGTNGTAISVTGDNVTISSLNLTNNEGTGIEINGSGATIEDIAVTGGNGTAITVTGDNTTISAVTIENNAGDGIAVNGSGAKLDEITVSGSNGTAISVTGNNSTVSGVNLTNNNGNGIAVEGSGATLGNVTVSGSNGTAVSVAGDNSTVSGVNLTGNNGDGIAVNGSGAKLDDIAISGGNGTAVSVAGDNTTVSGVNLTNNNGNGIAVNGSGAKLDEITVSGSNGTAVTLTGDNSTVSGVNLTGNNGNGIAVNGSGAKLDEITVSGGNGTAINVTGNNVEVSGVNLTGNNGTGITVEGSGATLGNVTVSGGNGTAIAVAGNNTVVSGINLEGNNGTGIAINGSGAKLDDISVSGGNGTAINVTGNNVEVSGVNLTGNNGDGIAVNGSGAKLDDIAVSGGNGTAVSVAGDNSTVSGVNLTNNNGNGIAVEGAGATLGNVTVSGGNGTAISVAGDNSTVSGVNLTNNNGNGIAVNGSGAKLNEIAVSGSNGTAVSVAGDNSTVSGVNLTNNNGNGIAVEGAGATLGNVTVSGSNGTAVSVAGDNSTVSGVNLTGNNGNGIAVNGSGAKLDEIAVSGSNGTAVSVAGDNSTVSGVNLTGNNGNGIAVEGAGATLGNVTVSGGNGTAVSVSGDNATLGEVSVEGNSGNGIAVNGSGAKLDDINVSGSNGTAVSVAGDNSTVSGVNLTGNSGTGIEVNGSGADIAGISVTGGNGTAMAVNGDNASIKDATFANNTGTNNVGVVINGNGASVENTTFANNTGETGTGIVTNGNGTKISNSTFTGNNATKGGSSIVIGSNVTDTDMGDNTFEDNSGTDVEYTPVLDVTIPEKLKVGDDLVVEVTINGATGTVTLTINDLVQEATLTNNKTQFTVSGLGKGEYTVVVTYLGDGNYIGATKSYTVSFDYATFTDLQELINEAIANNQTEITLDYDYKFNESDSVIEIPEGITINGNGHTIDAQGQSGIFNVTGDNVVLSNITLSNGNAEEGGAIVWNGANGTIENANLINNSAENGGAIVWNGDNATIKDSTFENNTATESGAGVILNGNDATVEGSTFAGNNATTGAGIVTTGNNTKIEDSTFANNTAETGAGVISEGSNTTISGSEFTGNNATTGAGAVLNGANATVAGSTFAGNNATEGAGIVSNGEGTSIKDTEFANNTASEGAGAVLNGDGAKVDNATFVGNDADNGAGIVATGNGAEISNSTFANNTAMTGAGIVSNGNGTSISGSNFTGNNAESGAGVILNGENATVENATFSGNQAVNGAGVVSNGNGTSIKGTEFTNNTAETGAGAVLNGDGAKVENSTFAGNNATTGAGAVLNGNNASVAGSTFANNTAETGAGIVSEGNGTSISGTEFTGNNATTGAGAVLNGNGAAVENSTFSGNKAETGAGVVSEGNGTSISGTEFTGNTAETGAGAVLNGNGAKVENSTFSGNNATTGAGVVSNGEGTNITGSTFANNTAETGAGAVLNGANATVGGNTSFTGNNASSGSAIALGDNATGANTTGTIIANNTGSEIGKNPTIILDIPSLVKVDFDAVINVTVENAKGNVTLFIDEVEIETKALDGDSKVSFTVSDLTKGKYAIRVYYSGENGFTSTLGVGLLGADMTEGYGPGTSKGTLTVKYSNFADLQKVISDAIAEGKDTIVLEHDYEFDSEDGDTVIVIPEGITIDGANHWVSGAGESIIFNITGEDVTLKNIQLINAKGEDGGAIVWSGDNGVIENATLANNSADKGGAILWTGDNATIKDSTFENNSATTGGAVVIEGNDATVEGSTFTGNNATEGAGIVSNGNGTKIKDTEFANNTAETGAGAVLNGDGAKVDNATFTGNNAETGAGIVATGKDTEISNSTFANNTATTGAGVVSEGSNTTISGSEFTGNTAGTGAGAVLNGDNATVEGSTFTGNEADNGAGVVSNGEGTSIKDTEFANNTATEQGAGVILNGDGAKVNNATFTGNDADEGAGIVATGDNVEIKDSTFANNTAITGAGVVSNGTGTSISGSNFTGNIAESGAGVVLEGDNATVAGSEFTGNEAVNGAGIVTTGNNTKVEDTKFTNNTAETGAGVLSEGSNTTISGSEFTGNNATTGAGAVLNGANASVEGSTFAGNNATEGAGVVSNGEGTSIKDTEFANNTAQQGAGAVLNGNDASVANATFTGNEADNGAGIVATGDNANIANSTFANNTAMNGAGIVSNGTGTSISGSNFTGNNANSGAGVVLSGDNATVENATFSGNQAVNGAGIVSNGNGTSIKGTEFTNNTAETGAGAVLNGANATVEGSTFAGNNATEGAGVVSNGEGTSIKDTEFANNTAQSGAGAVLNGNGAKVDNATFAGNNATTGAGIVSNGNGTNVTGSTFANNTAETGAGMVVNGANSTVGNSSFTGNNATDSGSAISVGGNATGTDIKDDNKAENNTAAGHKDTNVATYFATVTVDPINTTAVGDDITITVNVKGDNIGQDGKVIITVNGANYESNLTNGKAVFTVPGTLAAGSYNVTVAYINDTVAQNANAQAELSVYNNASIAANDMTRGYNSGKDFEATFTDKYGKPLANADVQITVDGKVYTVRTDANGHAVLNVKLAPGRHTVVLKNPSDGSSVTKAVTIVASIQGNKNINIFYLGGYTYKVRAFGADGNPVGAGQIVSFKLNGKTYNVKTDANGWATLKLDIKNLVPKTKKYTVTATYNGFTVKNTIKVKQVIKAKKTTSVKKSKKLLKIKIVLKGKKVYKKKALKVKFKGKTYKLKTNKKGVAYFKVKQKVLKKLKAGKKYKYTVIYQKAKLTRYIKVKK